MSFYQLVQQSVAPSTTSLWMRSIWLHPRETIREIVTVNPQASVRTIAYWVTITYALSAGIANPAIVFILPLALLVAGPLVCTIGLSIRCGLLEIVSSLLGGSAESDKIRAAFVWPMCLHIWSLPIAFLAMVLSFGLFLENISPLVIIVLMLLILARVVISIWSFVLIVICVSEVNNFSIVRSLMAIILSDPLILLGLMALLVVSVGYGLGYIDM